MTTFILKLSNIVYHQWTEQYLSSMAELQVGQLKSIPKRVRLGKHGTILLAPNFLMHIYIYILGEA